MPKQGGEIRAGRRRCANYGITPKGSATAITLHPTKGVSNCHKTLCHTGYSTTLHHTKGVRPCAIKDRIEKQVKEVYGGDGVDFEPEALKKLEMFQSNPETAKLPVCVAKTQYSLSHDPKLLGRPKGWRMPVKDVLIYQGAGLIVPVAGEIKLMPGTSASPAFRRIDVDVETGKVRGLF